MDGRPLTIFGALALAVGLTATAVFPRPALGQAIPYPEKDCRALADDLAAAGPLPKPYKTEVEWFRDGDLGIKGEQCRISARGVARKDKDAKARPGIGDIARSVTGVLKRHGFKGERLLKRYKREGDATRSFALRKDRATCWTNLESEDIPGTPAVPKIPSPTAKAAPKPPARIAAPVWRLTVDCFLG
jgi:hypothetical protein